MWINLSIQLQTSIVFLTATHPWNKNENTKPYTRHFVLGCSCHTVASFSWIVIVLERGIDSSHCAPAGRIGNKQAPNSQRIQSGGSPCLCRCSLLLWGPESCASCCKTKTKSITSSGAARRWESHRRTFAKKINKSDFTHITSDAFPVIWLIKQKQLRIMCRLCDFSSKQTSLDPLCLQQHVVVSRSRGCRGLQRKCWFQIKNWQKSLSLKNLSSETRSYFSRWSTRNWKNFEASSRPSKNNSVSFVFNPAALTPLTCPTYVCFAEILNVILFCSRKTQRAFCSAVSPEEDKWCRGAVWGKCSLLMISVWFAQTHNREC